MPSAKITIGIMYVFIIDQGISNKAAASAKIKLIARE